MKHLLIIGVCLLTLGAAHAQQPTVPAGRGEWAGKVLDTTVTNAGTPAVVIPIIGNKSALSFQYVITKTSGTLSGTVSLYGSLDGGTTYALINAYTITDATASTSLTYGWAGYSKYKVIVSTGSSQVANYKVYTLYRQ